MLTGDLYFLYAYDSGINGSQGKSQFILGLNKYSVQICKLVLHNRFPFMCNETLYNVLMMMHQCGLPGQHDIKPQYNIDILMMEVIGNATHNVLCNNLRSILPAWNVTSAVIQLSCCSIHRYFEGRT